MLWESKLILQVNRGGWPHRIAKMIWQIDLSFWGNTNLANKKWGMVPSHRKNDLARLIQVWIIEVCFWGIHVIVKSTQMEITEIGGDVKIIQMVKIRKNEGQCQASKSVSKCWINGQARIRIISHSKIWIKLEIVCECALHQWWR